MSFRNWTQADVEAHNAKVFGRGGEPRTSPLEIVGLAKAEAAPVAAEAMPEEHSSITCEKEQHDEIMKWADGVGLPYDHSPMDRPQYQGNGRADFLFFLDGKMRWVEQKFGKGKLTKAQSEWQFQMSSAGNAGLNSWTVAETIAYLRREFFPTEINKLKEKE